MTDKIGQAIGAMAFYASDGFAPAWNRATVFAGRGGRVATMADVVDARIAAENPYDSAWTSYYTTASSEFYGTSPGGVAVLAVLHGTGPLSTLDGILQAYAHDIDDTHRERHGGRVTLEVFHEILDGRHGSVDVVEVDPILSRYEHPFMEPLTPQQVLDEPLMRARMGGEARLAAYVAVHRELARSERAEAMATRPGAHDPEGKIVDMGEASNGRYTTWRELPGGKAVMCPRTVADGQAIAHLLSVGGLVNANRSCSRIPHLEFDLNPHDWGNGARFLGIRAGAAAHPIHGGLSYREAVSRDPAPLWVVVPDQSAQGPTHVLMKIGDDLYTQYQNPGVSLDSFEPMFAVIEAETLGDPVAFVVETAGYHAFFRYGIDDVMKSAPEGANAYRLVGDPYLIGGDAAHQGHHAQFYRVTVDASRRLLREGEVLRDMPLLLNLCKAA